MATTLPKFADLLNLPTAQIDTPAVIELTKSESQEHIETSQLELTALDDTIDKINAALPQVDGLDSGDAELDELSSFAKQKADDMIDLGMNMDPRFSGPIFQTASVLLGHAITAKTAKLDKKLKMVTLQLQQAKLAYQIKKDAKLVDVEEDPIDGKGMVLDRTELLRQILESNKKQ